jgi:hypothetical protein
MAFRLDDETVAAELQSSKPKRQQECNAVTRESEDSANGALVVGP